MSSQARLTLFIVGFIVGFALGLTVGFSCIPARALTDGTTNVCQPRSWSDCQTMERFTPIHAPTLKITDKVGGRIG